jgi:hypothetical protein
VGILQKQKKLLDGNGKIHRYPLEKLLIFSKKTFKELNKELRQLIPKPSKPKKHSNVKLKKTIVPEPRKQRIHHEHQPTNVIYMLESNPWRWRRVNEWFAQHGQMEAKQISIFDEIVALRGSQGPLI